MGNTGLQLQSTAPNTCNTELELQSLPNMGNEGSKLCFTSHNTYSDEMESSISSSDNESDYQSSGTEWVPRKSDENDSLEDSEIYNRNQENKKYASSRYISESDNDESDRNSDIWPMLS